MYFFLQRKQQQQSITEIERNDNISVVGSIPHFQNSRLVQFLSNINQHVSMYIQCSLSARTGHTTCSKSILHDQCNSGQLRAHSKHTHDSGHTQSTLRTHSGYLPNKQISLPFSFLLVGLSTAGTLTDFTDFLDLLFVQYFTLSIRNNFHVIGKPFAGMLELCLSL